MPIEVPCAYYGKVLRRTPSSVQDPTRVFCNKAHYFAWLKSPEGKGARQRWQRPPTVRVPFYLHQRER